MTDLMPRPRPPYVNREVTRHGKVVWYFRRGNGPRVRLPAPYSEGFDEAYEGALTGTPTRSAPRKAAHGTLEWLIAQYMATAEWATYAPITRRNRQYIYQRMVAKSGQNTAAKITTAMVQATVDKQTPGAARAFMKAIRPPFAWAKAAGHIEINPTEGVRVPKPKGAGFHTWTPEEVEAYERRHPVGTMARLAMDLLLYTGLRRSDAVQIGRQHIRDGWLTFRANKNAAMIERPILSPLTRSIEATEIAGLTLLTTSHGDRFTANGFGNWFAERCKEASVPGRAHGLRKAGAVIAAERGATDRQLMAIFGWKSAHMATLYTQKADRRRLAEEASKLLENGK